jgi:hypothetical protein
MVLLVMRRKSNKEEGEGNFKLMLSAWLVSYQLSVRPGRVRFDRRSLEDRRLAKPVLTDCFFPPKLLRETLHATSLQLLNF